MCGCLLVTLTVFYLPFAGAGERLVSSLFLMGREWAFNGSLAALLACLFPATIAHYISLALLGLLCVVAMRLRGELLRKLVIVQIIWVICSATLFPWYLIWVLPLLVLRFEPALAALVLLAPLSHEVLLNFQTTGVWAPKLWPGLIEYGLFYGLLIAGWRRGSGVFSRTVAGE